MWRENLARSMCQPHTYLKQKNFLSMTYIKKSSKIKIRDIFNDYYYFEKFLEDFIS